MTAQTLAEFKAETRRLAQASFKSTFGATWLHEIGSEKPKRNWLFKNLLLSSVFGIIYGGPGGGKSFLTTDMALTGALAAVRGGKAEWFGHRCKGFGCVYIVAEGREDFEIRLHAWRTENGVGPDEVLPFVFLPTSIDMRSSDADMLRLAQEINVISEQMKERCGVPAGMTVVDTVARALAGGNENASDVMGTFVVNCDKLKDLTSTTVLGVHHGGKELGRGPRGHESLHGAADFELEVVGATDDEPNCWTVRKLKAGPAGATFRFRLKQRTVNKDEDGDPVTSCVVVDFTEAPENKAAARHVFHLASKYDKWFASTLSEAINFHGIMVPQGVPAPSNVKLVVTQEQVKRMYVERYSATEDGTEEQVYERLKARWGRSTGSLIEKKLIGSYKGKSDKNVWLWMTGQEIAGVKLRGADPWAPKVTAADLAQGALALPADETIGDNDDPMML